MAFTETAHDVVETDDGRFLLNFGPQHPATHGTLRMVMELEGERIIKVTPEIGFLHTGFEKLGEHLSYTQFITLTDRMNYMSAIANNVGFAVAVEELCAIDVPERAQIIRVIMAELTRIADHILCMGLMAMDLGAFSVMLWAFEKRETVYDVIEAVCGARLTTSWTRIGGIMRDVPGDFVALVEKTIDGYPQTTGDILDLLDKNKIWNERLQGIGHLSYEDVVAYGVTGPVARSSGCKKDIRKARPYMGYETYDFDVPVLEEGDSYARFMMRALEIEQSLKIIRQGLKRVKKTQGQPVKLQSGKITRPEKYDVYNDMESMINHFETVMWGHGLRAVKGGEIYSCTESPNGELGYFIASNDQGSPIPYRVRVRPPSFYHFQVVPLMVEGGLISDALAVLAGVNVIAGELDR